MRILGIDPGSRLTGYGIIDLVGGPGAPGRQLRHVAHGTLRLSNTGGKAVIPLEQRLLSIHEGIGALIREHRPTVMSIERVFFAKNAVSALKLGQARGATILCGAIHSLEIVEYSPSEVKQALVGYGLADKQQVAKMVRLVLGNLEFATSDASDGLALAICHAYTLADQKRGGSVRAEIAQALKATTSKARRPKRGGGLAEALGITPDGKLLPRRSSR